MKKLKVVTVTTLLMTGFLMLFTMISSYPTLARGGSGSHTMVAESCLDNEGFACSYGNTCTSGLRLVLPILAWHVQMNSNISIINYKNMKNLLRLALFCVLTTLFLTGVTLNFEGNFTLKTEEALASGGNKQPNAMSCTTCDGVIFAYGNTCSPGTRQCEGNPCIQPICLPRE